ncbi:ABC transporter permease [Nocardioides sp. LHG3406-4]|uniref:ABC transporter permease n=1 Tax=Nocardioides sp. LHG3406-4 TaxID=2804575 RepID=UPI003CF2500D
MSVTSANISEGGSIELGGSATRKRRSLSLSAMIGGTIVAAVVVAALLSFVWTPYNPVQVDAASRFLSPSGEHWLGTDALGRDVFSNLLAGARIALLVGLITVGVGGLIGVPLGVFAAMSSGFVSVVAEKVIDLLLVFPALLLAIAFGSIWGSSTQTAMLAIGIAVAPGFARLARAGTLQVLSSEYVMAARVAGHGRLSIVVRHVLPNISGILLVQASVVYGVAVLAESGLSFLGFGTTPPTPSWGLMLQQAQTALSSHPLLSLWPAGAICVAVLGFNLLGDGLRDHFDPRLDDRR